MATTKPLVLSRLAAGQQIADKNGIADPRHIQTLNNAFRNIATNEAALAANEAELAQQQTANATLTQNVADALAALAAVQGQVSAVSGAQTSFALAESFTSPAVVLSSATSNGSATITVAAHTRRYADGSSVTVNGGSFAVTTKGTSYWVIYSDTARKGGAVSFQVTTDPAAAAQIAGVHNLGSVYVSSGNATNLGTPNYGPGVQAPAAQGSFA